MSTDDDDLEPGELVHRVTLLAPDARPDRNDLGETIDTGAAEVRTWANVKFLSGRELVYAQQVAAEATVLVKMRHREGVDRFKALEFEGRTLNIDAALPSRRKRVLRLYCRTEE